MKNIIKLMSSGFLLLGTAGINADQVILDDLIVDGSACIGFDCVNGESFGFDTLRLKENNLRIRAQDTSSSASFPSNDWQITFNDSSNGGANKFSVDDIDGGRTPFTIEANAPSHSLYVDDGGRLGLGTSTPVVDVHVKSGNTPTMRLEQDGSSGFAPQAWDVAGNETNFFIRDATNGSTLPFRIFPGAPSSALTIEASTGDIGIGTKSPAGPLHVENTAGDDVDDFIVTADGDVGLGTIAPSASMHVVRTAGAPATLLKLENDNTTKLTLNNTGTGAEWGLSNGSTGFRISKQGSGSVEMELFASGNVTIAGALTQNSDVNSKTAITEIDNLQILAMLEKLPVQKWEYKAALGEQHIGPMAQDFYAAFGLGVSETGISTIDTAGVALAAIKALIEKNKLLEQSIRQLQQENEAMQAAQNEQYGKLKAMVIDLQINANAKAMLTKLE